MPLKQRATDILHEKPITPILKCSSTICAKNTEITFFIFSFFFSFEFISFTILSSKQIGVFTVFSEFSR